MQKGTNTLKWFTVSRQRTTKKKFQKKKQPRKPHSNVLNRGDRRFVLVPVEICTETAAASVFPTTVAESQIIGYDMIWYENSLLGVNTLAAMMKEISLGAGLSQMYTNHSVRATAITLWPNANVPSRDIMSISGHANEQSTSSYSSRPSVKQLKNCSS